MPEPIDGPYSLREPAWPPGWPYRATHDGATWHAKRGAWWQLSARIVPGDESRIDAGEAGDQGPRLRGIVEVAP